MHSSEQMQSSHPPSSVGDSMRQQRPSTSPFPPRPTSPATGVTAAIPRRGYKACTHCRSRKTRCDLGDVNAPSAPPCSRCKREQKECVFPPSKRKRSATQESASSRGGGGDGRNTTSVADPNALSSRAVAPRNDQSSFALQTQAIRSDGRQHNNWANDTALSHLHSDSEDHVPIPFFPSNTSEHLLTEWNHQSGMSVGTGLPVVDDPLSFLQNGGPIQHHSSAMIESSNWMTGLTTPLTRHPGHIQSVETTAFNSDQNHPDYRQSSAIATMQHAPTGPRTTTQAEQNTSTVDIPSYETSGNSFTSATPTISNWDPSPVSLAPLDEGRDTDHPVTEYEVNKRRRLNSMSFAKDSSHRPSRRQHTSDSRDIVVADMHNESDALDILAMAALGGKKDKGRGQGSSLTRGGQRPFENAGEDLPNESDDFGETLTYHSVPLEDETSTLKRQAPRSNFDTSVEHSHDNRSHVTGRPSDPSPMAPNSTKTSARHTVRMDTTVDYIPDPDDDLGDVAVLSDFPLVEQGIADEEQVMKLCRAFFQRHHHIFPILSPSRIPRTDAAIARFSRDERYLLTAIIIIASRPDPSPSMRRIHAQAWEVMKEYLSEIAFCGALPTVGLVEGLLLLAENLPRGQTTSLRFSQAKPRTKEGKPVVSGGAENRQAWMLIGMAIRAAYGLGLDQLSRNAADAKSTPELERSRLAWTYCYIFDRQISIRTGKAFWSRGPSLCFQGYSNISQTGPAAAADYFPSLNESHPADDTDNAGRQEDESIGDSASLVQAYLELTQLMTNVHDVFYPSTNRLHSLVEHGEYFKYLDDFNSALESFKTTWSRRRWKQFPLSHLVWCMFHYVRLYTCSFAFQAHIQRSSERAKRERLMAAAGSKVDQLANRTHSASFFPRCSASTPDALYIYESIHAAGEILSICVDILSPKDVLLFLPSRFLLWFLYAAVFLLKAVYSGAMVKADHAATLALVERTCTCLITCSTDKEHPAVRYGSMIRLLSAKLSQQSDTSAFPSRAGTPDGTLLRTSNISDLEDIPAGEGGPRSREAVEGTSRPQTHMNLPTGDTLLDGDLSQWLSFQANADTWNTNELAQDDLLRRLLDEPAAQTGLSDYNYDYMMWNGMQI